MPLDYPVEKVREDVREVKKLGNIFGATGGNHAGNVYDHDSLAPSISTCGGGDQQPMVVAIDEQNMMLRTETVGTLTADGNSPKKNNRIARSDNQYRIRKLCPVECFLLMGFTKEEFYKAAEVQSNTQLYKQAGNSIVVDVLVALFQEIVNAEGTVNDHKGEQINLFDILNE